VLLPSHAVVGELACVRTVVNIKFFSLVSVKFDQGAHAFTGRDTSWFVARKGRYRKRTLRADQQLRKSKGVLHGLVPDVSGTHL